MFMPSSTPQRQVPGGYAFTPAVSRQSHDVIPQPYFARQSSALNQKTGSSGQQDQRMPQSQSRAAPAGGASGAASGAVSASTSDPSPLERAARTINEVLALEARFPEMESYVVQGISAEYEISDPKKPAWNPFQKVRMYELPQQIFAQLNEATVSTHLGLFPELQHAFMVVDTAIYLWDYTHPNPELIGFEEQNSAIVAVKLVAPRPGVFNAAIKYMLVIATTTEIMLIGVAAEDGPAGSGGKIVTLYNTRMSVPVRGQDITCIEGSAKSGRIFYTTKDNDNVWELAYKQEEGWFSGKCTKKNHEIRSYFDSLVPFHFRGYRPVHQFVKQMVIDDTRNLLYTLSNTDTIKTYLMRDDLPMVLVRPFQSLITNVGHMLQSQSNELLAGRDVHLASISTISANEAGKISLMATTTTGCRLYISATRHYGTPSDVDNAPTSMQVLHIKFPPKLAQQPAAGAAQGQPAQQQRQTQQTVPYQYGAAGVDTRSRSLLPTVNSSRLAPGYFINIIKDPAENNKLRAFIAAPDSARIKNPQDQSQMSRFSEFGQFMDFDAGVVSVQSIDSLTSTFAAADRPLGFGNEVAVQFDQPTAEIAMMTEMGVQTIRRRRLVDTFAAMIRQGGGAEGLEGDIKKFIRLYGRGETAATALAVACGQGLDVTSDNRVASITDPDVVEQARKVFIEQGGRAELNLNAASDNASDINNVRPSPRHEGMALYISRLVRSIWKAPIMKEKADLIRGMIAESSVKLSKLQGIQSDLKTLSELLNKNKTFIQGFGGADSGRRNASPQEQTENAGEHRAMESLRKLIIDVIEGIAFVLTLFDEKVEEVLLRLPEDARSRVRALTFEGLFTSAEGKELARQLVKAIVNLNIANGSNVDTVADQLRRRCGSFCSADDVIIFKAQEQLKRASEAGPTTETGRVLLNESQRLFQKVAGSLTMEQLQWVVEQYITTAFYAGAVQLSLSVANESDRANRAWAWLNEGMPEPDDRTKAYEKRKQCYDLIFSTIKAVEEASKHAPDTVDGNYTLVGKRRKEAFGLIYDSDDKLFQTTLYDWYMSQGWQDRLLEVESDFVVEYLRRKASEDQAHADLLWKYFGNHNRFYDAATVQLDLAKCSFPINLEERMGYLSRARANASTRMKLLLDTRQSRQQLLREISDLLDVGNIQADILQRIRGETRIAADRRPEIIAKLDGLILDISELFNAYADQAGYHDICILCYQAADHRVPTDVHASWQSLISQTHAEAQASPQGIQPYEAVADVVRRLGHRLGVSDATFPVPWLLPALEKYAFTYQRDVGAPTWVVDIFIDLEAPFELLVQTLENMYYANEQPFQGRNRRLIACDLVYTIGRWVEKTDDEPVLLGDVAAAEGVVEMLSGLVRGGDLGDRRGEVDVLIDTIKRSLS